MRASQFLLATQKETPADAVVISHQLMLRAGLIRKAASGLYVWLPLGLKVLRKVEQVVREEMDRAGAQEVLMPMVQPAELWRESGRWDQFGPELTRFKDRHDNAFCLGPTHEEVITDLARGELKSYRQLPVNFYQIQTKFRDEVRPRFGVMRSREFIMKDAYSFHVDVASMQATYEVMYRAYSAIFTRLGLGFRAVLADTGAIGGSASHEFHVLAESGEDAIAFSSDSDFAANIEMAEALAPAAETAPAAALTEVATPGVASINEAAAALGLHANRLVKTLIVYGAADDAGKRPLVALVLRGDHTLNEVKAGKLAELGGAVQFASEADIRGALDVGPGSIGPCGLKIPVLVDHAARALVNFACGAGRDGAHLTNANWNRDASCTRAVDLRNVERGDPSPDGRGQLDIKRGIEVGHIFQLGDKYSKAMGMQVLGEDGRQLTPLMGCYGIGVSRIVAAAIEQNHDARGIIWPEALAPFQVALVPVNMQKSQAVSDTCEALYETLRAAGLEVLFMDDPKARLGVMLADVELVGIPHRIVVGERGLANGEVEYQYRRAEAAVNVNVTDVLATIAAQAARA